MGFGDLNSDSGISNLNDYLKDKSFIEGDQPSAADTVVYASVASALHINPEFNHALRWFTHITSYGKGITAFPGVPKSLATYGTICGTPEKLDKKAIDNVGHEEEEQLKHERLASCAAKKTDGSTTPAVQSKSHKKDDENEEDDEDIDPFTTDPVKKEKLKQQRIAALHMYNNRYGRPGHNMYAYRTTELLRL